MGETEGEGGCVVCVLGMLNNAGVEEESLLEDDNEFGSRSDSCDASGFGFGGVGNIGDGIDRSGFGSSSVLEDMKLACVRSCDSGGVSISR